MDHQADVRPVRLEDALARPLRDLRISLTDRCNFRCTYCMPKAVFGPDHAFLPAAELLTPDEIIRVAAVFARLGVTKLRLTGGEPLLRHDLADLVAKLGAIPGIADIALTTNGSQLTAARARSLRAAGLSRITVSLDAIDDAVFQAMNDVKFPVARVLAAIDAAREADLRPVKINMVVKRGVNDQQILPMAEHFRGSGCILRFIEYMDVGNTNRWQMTEVVPAAEVVRQIHSQWPLEPMERVAPGDVARRYRYVDGQGEIGVISSVTQPFCGHCTRARLSPEGRLFTCLFAAEGFDVRRLLRTEASDDEVAAAIREVWRQRTDRYSELRQPSGSTQPKVEMSHIGG